MTYVRVPEGEDINNAELTRLLQAPHVVEADAQVGVWPAGGGCPLHHHPAELNGAGAGKGGAKGSGIQAVGTCGAEGERAS
eukprot:1981665-Pyramimonas_sp.AAC.1